MKYRYLTNKYHTVEHIIACRGGGGVGLCSHDWKLVTISTAQSWHVQICDPNPLLFFVYNIVLYAFCFIWWVYSALMFQMPSSPVHMQLLNWRILTSGPIAKAIRKHNEYYKVIHVILRTFAHIGMFCVARNCGAHGSQWPASFHATLPVMEGSPGGSDLGQNWYPITCLNIG